MTRVKIFIDTEFTNLVDFDLISIALVSGDDWYYAESAEFNVEQCEEFTRKNVLPLLGGNLRKSRCAIATEIVSWMSKYADQSPMLCFDNVIDFGLLRELLGEIPNWLGTHSVKHRVNDEAKVAFLTENGLAAHHALSDARALQHGNLVWLGQQ